MTTYYFDEQENKLIAYDADTKALRELLPVSLAGSNPASEVAALEPERRAAPPVSRQRRGQHQRPVTPTKVGCNECGSLGRRHKKGCKLAGGSAEASSKKMKGTPEWQALGEVTEPSKKMSRMTFGRVKISQ
jgi:hypothetical protein